MRDHRIAVVVLFGTALLVRGLLVAQIGRTPYFEVGNIDSTASLQWAARIAAGAWLPTGTFYQSPFYAYFLAVVYKIFGAGPWIPRVVQVVIGSFSPVLLYAIGTRLFSPRVGWLAGLGLAFYGPLILEEITFSKTTLLIVTALAGFELYLRYAPRGATRGMLAAGALFGLTVVGVGQWLLAFLALIAWVPRMAEHLPRARRRQAAAAFAAGGLAIILPLAAWNTATGGGLLLASSDAGLNFYMGNNERASGLPSAPLGVRDTPQYEEGDARRLAESAVRHSLTPAEVGRYWSGKGFDWITQHPGDWLALLSNKFAVFWNGYEIPDNYHYSFVRAYFLPWLWPLVTFSLVAPLALVGVVTPFWRRRDLTALYIACFGYITTLLIFYVRGRYRIPAVPFLLLFAAVGVDGLLRAAYSRRWQAVSTLVGGLALAGIFTNHEYCEPTHAGMNGFCLGGDTWFDQEWLKLAEWYRNAGRLDLAIAYVERAPECTRPRSRGQILMWIGDLHAMRTEELMKQGRRDEAMTHFAQAEQAYQKEVGIPFRKGPTEVSLGNLYALMGKPTEAVAAFEAAQAAGTGISADSTRRLARAYVDLRRCSEAEQVLTKLDQGRGLTGPPEETLAILTPCGERQ